MRLLKTAWLRLLQKGTAFTNKHGRFDNLYRVEDPWEMESTREQKRFEVTNRLIEREFGVVDTILEIGCGEGHQTAHLARMCNEIYGMDVSERAVRRARQRCPKAHLTVSHVGDYRPPVTRFDLVVACEVLYYLKDLPGVIDKMQTWGRNCLVTYFDSGVCNLDSRFASIEGVKIESISADGTAWKVATWSSQNKLG